jgi:hypothetical protein
MKSSTLWNVTPESLQKVSGSSHNEMEQIRSSETSFNFQRTARFDIPEDRTLDALLVYFHTFLVYLNMHIAVSLSAEKWQDRAQ